MSLNLFKATFNSYPRFGFLGPGTHLRASILLGLIAFLLFPTFHRTVTGDSTEKINIDSLLENLNPEASYPEIEILNPLDNSVFPPEMASPFFKWKDNYDHADGWIIQIRFRSDQESIHIHCKDPQWIPAKEIWETMKQNSFDSPARITIMGFQQLPVLKIVSMGMVRIRTAHDPVGASIMFRRVPPSFSYANEHPELMEWCFADIASYEEPPVIMSHQPFCASCHTFSRNGEILGMDMDYQGDKGAYLLTELGENIALKEENFIHWNSYPRNDGLLGSGLFSRLSPDGRHVVSTVNDISFLAKISDPYCSQLFFPIQGQLAIYSSLAHKITPLFTGENSPETVETDASWSPDGESILFSRAHLTRDLYAELGGDTIFSAADTDIETLDKQYPIHFDVYRVGFNAGKGGVAVPLKGAGHNGKSNYFARYSPNGRWIVFTQSDTGLVLQPDSRLYIIPASGGSARLMTCNRSRMNSWHTWSPNSRWLGFVSKENMPYTELYLTHIDEYGNDSVPVLISRFNKPGFAVNVPEFININAGDIRNISLQSGH
jgi:hypothetical protein